MLPVPAVVAAIVVAAAAGVGGTLAAFSGQTSNAPNAASADTLAPPSGLTAAQACAGSGTVDFVASASATGTGGNLTISKPTGVVAGHVMVAHFSTRAGSSSITPPADWTLVRDDSMGTELQSAIYVKVAGPSEPTTYQWTSSALGRTAGGIAAYSGVDASNPVDVHGASVGFDKVLIAPSVTTTTTNTRLIAFWSVRQEPINTTDAMMTQRWNVKTAGGANGLSDAAADEARPEAGATGLRAASVTTAFDWVAQSVALRPPGTAQASLSWTATPSTFATGHKVQRWVGATQENEQTVTPRTQTTATDGPLVAGTTYRYELFAYHQSWVSSRVTATLTPTAC